MQHEQIRKQRDYYNKTAGNYDATCAFDPDDEHFIGAATLSGLINHFGIRSVLDVGCGTGRAMLYLKQRHPDLELHGVEPVEALRLRAYEKGLAPSQVTEGDACQLKFADSSFDCVTAFGVLHHIPDPNKAIQEMKRVSRSAIFISDHNVYGMGSRTTKAIKQLFRDLRLKAVLRLMLTAGKGYHDTSWDGIFYPFSIADHLEEIKFRPGKSFTFSTKSGTLNLYRESSHIGVFSVRTNA